LPEPTPKEARMSAPSALPSIGVALLVSSDGATIDPVSESLRELAISTEVCVDMSAAPRLMEQRHFGAIVVDLQLGDQARKLLKRVRRIPSNRTAVVFAITDNDAETAVALKDGSNFVLRRPLSEGEIGQCLRAAYGLILREQRRYFRCHIGVPTALWCAGSEGTVAHAVNISEGGMGILIAVALRPGVEVQVRFSLPGDDFKFAVRSTVSWCHHGRMGLQFRSLPASARANLRAWLSRRLEQSLPESVAAKFRTLRLR
jgi:ActR/RegA family two-component response regulator